MWVWPKSHLRGSLYDSILRSDVVLDRDLQSLRKFGGTIEEWNAWGRRLQAATADLLEVAMIHETADRVPILIDAGDLLLFDRRLVHGTFFPESPGVTRWSIVARFQGRHATERGWPTSIGSSVYELAREVVPPTEYEVARYSPKHAWRALHPRKDARRMFWEGPLNSA